MDPCSLFRGQFQLSNHASIDLDSFLPSFVRNEITRKKEVPFPTQRFAHRFRRERLQERRGERFRHALETIAKRSTRRLSYFPFRFVFFYYFRLFFIFHPLFSSFFLIPMDRCFIWISSMDPSHGFQSLHGSISKPKRKVGWMGESKSTTTKKKKTNGILSS